MRLVGATGLWLVLLTLVSVLPSLPPASWWAVAGAILVSELWAPALPRFGFFSVSAPMVVVMRTAPGAAGWVLSLSLLARSLRKGISVNRLLEAAADALPALLALNLIARWPEPAVAVAAALAWLALALMVPDILAAGLPEDQGMEWMKARQQLRGALISLAFPLAVFPFLNDWLAVALFPALFGLQALVRQPGSLHNLRVKRLGMALEDEKARGLEARQGQEKMRQLALRRADELGGLERLTRALTRNEALETTLEAVLDMAMRAAPNTDSAVLFLRQEGVLQPVAARTPHQERVRDAVLLKLREPVLDEVVRLGGSLYNLETKGEGRVFVGEISLAIALEEEGVLYLGTTDPAGFSNEMREILGVVAAQAVVALQSARRLESERQARQQHQAALTRLERWVQRLGLLLDGSATVTSTLDPEELARRLETMLRQVVPNEAGAVVFVDGRTHLWGGASIEAARELSRTVAANARPLLLERRRDARLPPLNEQGESLVSVPLLAESTCVGVITLSRPEEAAFAREDQDLLQLVGYLSAVAYVNTRRHHDLIQTQGQLAQANKLAAVGQLAAGVAHELNSPLGAILLASEAALLRPEAAPARLEKIRQATVRAQKIVSNLLIYCQGGLPAPREQVDLIELVDQALSDFGDDLQVVRRLAPGLTAQANPVQMLQVLSNLLGNARDAQAKQVLLESWADGERACLAVHDNGPGVPEELSERIFEPFFTTRPVGHGTGLGLSICHQLVTQQQGTLELVRDGRAGARFVLALPRPLQAASQPVS